MRKILTLGILILMALTVGAAAAAEENPLTEAEIISLAEQVRALALKQQVLNDPTQEEAVSEDGYALQFDFGVIYGDQPSWSEETGINAMQIMDGEIAGPRGIAIDWDVNRLMAAVPCENEEMNGNYEEAVLYLIGDAEGSYLYGRTERDGQRISAMEYGAVDVPAGRKVTLNCAISGDGITAIRVEGLQETFARDALAELYQDLDALTRQFSYARVPRSLVGTELEMFQEADLDFSCLSYRTAEPAVFGDNVEDMLIDNEDGTWLRRIDGDGFVAVFTCDSQGNNAQIRSFEILSPELEGPRCVRLGDLFHEDFTRFRSGEGELDENGLTEVLYGTVGTAPYGLAEYGDGTEMTLRYVTPTLGGPDVELLLRYEDTALTEIILHTLEEDEE